MSAELVLREALDALVSVNEYPKGPQVDRQTYSVATGAAVKIAGDPPKAQALWKLIREDCGGYVPQAAALALIRASDLENLVPYIEPDLSEW